MSNGEKDEQTRKELLNEIMKKYGDDVIRLAYVYVKDIETAKDIAQDVFIKCYENVHKFRHESSYKTWILKITSNCSKDYLRSGHYKYIRIHQFVTQLIRGNFKSPEEEVILNTEKDDLTQCVLKLQNKYREVIILYYYQELTIKEISYLIGKSENTIKTRLLTARSLLAKQYKKEERGEEYGR